MRSFLLDHNGRFYWQNQGIRDTEGVKGSFQMPTEPLGEWHRCIAGYVEHGWLRFS